MVEPVVEPMAGPMVSVLLNRTKAGQNVLLTSGEI